MCPHWQREGWCIPSIHTATVQPHSHFRAWASARGRCCVCVADTRCCRTHRDTTREEMPDGIFRRKSRNTDTDRVRSGSPIDPEDYAAAVGEGTLPGLP